MCVCAVRLEASRVYILRAHIHRHTHTHTHTLECMRGEHDQKVNIYPRHSKYLRACLSVGMANSQRNAIMDESRDNWASLVVV